MSREYKSSSQQVIPDEPAQNKIINKLRKATGASLAEAAKAIDLCGNYDTAKEYLRLRYSAVARYKVVEGKKVPFDTADYVNLAKKNLNAN